MNDSVVDEERQKVIDEWWEKRDYNIFAKYLFKLAQEVKSKVKVTSISVDYKGFSLNLHNALWIKEVETERWYKASVFDENNFEIRLLCTDLYHIGYGNKHKIIIRVCANIPDEFELQIYDTKDKEIIYQMSV